MASAETNRVKMTNDTNKQISADTNQANKEIAQMNNEFNLAMLDKQIAYNKEAYAQQVKDAYAMYDKQVATQWDFWNASNEYNSPANQMKRLEEAGRNPYLSDVSTGTSSSASAPSGSMPQMSGVDTPTATPYQATGWTAQKPDVVGALNAVATVTRTLNDAFNSSAKMPYELASMRQSLTGQALDNQYMARTLGSRVGAAISGAEGQKLQNDYQRVVNYFTPSLMASEATNKALQNQNLGITNSMLDVNLQWLPLEKRLQAGSYAADIVNKIQDGVLKGKEIERAKWIAMDAMYQAKGTKWTYDQKVRLEQYFDDAVKAGATPKLLDNPVGSVRSQVRQLRDDFKHTGVGRAIDGIRNYDGFVWWLPATW